MPKAERLGVADREIRDVLGVLGVVVDLVEGRGHGEVFGRLPLQTELDRIGVLAVRRVPLGQAGDDGELLVGLELKIEGVGGLGRRRRGSRSRSVVCQQVSVGVPSWPRSVSERE